MGGLRRGVLCAVLAAATGPAACRAIEGLDGLVFDLGPDGGADDASSSSGGSGSSSAGSGSSTSFSSSSSGCTAAVPADCTCPGSCMLPNASASCSGTTCVIDACNSNYADCNHDRADGCEADLQNDNLNCGSCATACVAPTQCKKGKCK